jgi:hypothetical protein
LLNYLTIFFWIVTNYNINGLELILM